MSQKGDGLRLTKLINNGLKKHLDMGWYGEISGAMMYCQEYDIKMVCLCLGCKPGIG